MKSPIRSKKSVSSYVGLPEKSQKAVPKPSAPAIVVNSAPPVTNPMGVKIVEFACGLLDLPALKRKYLSKKKQQKQKKALNDQRRKSFVVNESDKIMPPVTNRRKSKIGMF